MLAEGDSDKMPAL
ncbi:hypothetical protein PC111_g21357, partial [Phytophthora cactorum]